MGLDVIAWSHLKPWSPALKRLSDLGLSTSEGAIEISERDVKTGLWVGIEPGDYWTTGETEIQSFQVGSYSFWEQWKLRVFGALVEIGQDAVDDFKLLTRHNPSDGGWGAEACARLAQSFEKWEDQVLAVLNASDLDLVERCWAEFKSAFMLGAQDGAVMLN